MKAVIFGLKGTALSAEERTFFERTQPLGFILFRRNCENPDQIKALVHDLKSTVMHDDVPILIDQEGGRVVRLYPPYFKSNPPAHLFGDMYQSDPQTALDLVTENYALIAQELRELGITTNCAPCVDLPDEDSDPIIGDRAFSKDTDVTAALSAAVINAHNQNGIIPVIKHLPGHGRANADSHEKLPIIDANQETLISSDFSAFKIALESAHTHPWGMTAHIIYSAIDPIYCATESSTIIQQVIRNYIGFNGFLISDCISMKALSGSYTQRAERAIAAGCDAVLYCMCDLTTMIEIAAAVPELEGEALRRCFKRPESFSELTLESKDNWLKRDRIFQEQMTELGATWHSRLSTIGESTG
ncbi:MAG: beta-N-acetylhexosaminidase [Pseudomonadota bacterium]